MNKAIEFVAMLGIEDLYLLTDSAVDYFRRFGFQAVDRQAVPAELKVSAEFSEASCAGAVVMRRAVSAALAHTIRPARPEDVPVLIDLMEQLAITRSPSVQHRSGSEEEYRAAFAAIQADVRQSLVVIEADGQVAGTLTLVIVPTSRTAPPPGRSSKTSSSPPGSGAWAWREN